MILFSFGRWIHESTTLNIKLFLIFSDAEPYGTDITLITSNNRMVMVRDYMIDFVALTLLSDSDMECLWCVVGFEAILLYFTSWLSQEFKKSLCIIWSAFITLQQVRVSKNYPLIPEIHVKIPKWDIRRNTMDKKVMQPYWVIDLHTVHCVVTKKLHLWMR